MTLTPQSEHMQNAQLKPSRTRRHTWSWRSLAERSTDRDETELPNLSIEELIALTSDESVSAQRDHWVNSARASRG